MRYIINKISILLLLSSIFVACQEEIDDYFYKETETTVDSDIMSLLKQNADYSRFVELLEAYQIDTLLRKGNIFTFFVPNNSAMDNIKQGVLEDKDLVEYLITESYVNLNQISSHALIQTKGGKFGLIKAAGGSSYTFDDVEIVKGSPLANNGRYYEIAEVVQPKPSLYEYIAATNPFYRNYLDSQDSIYLDKELSTPIGYTEAGSTVYDTVLTTVNLFEEAYFPISQEFRDRKATMLLFTQEQYDRALDIVSENMSIPVENIPSLWQNDILMPYLITQSVFSNALPYTAFAKGRAKNILGDSVYVTPQNISPEYFESSNGRTYKFIDFQVPEQLYKVNDTIPMVSLLFSKGSGLWGWKEDVVVTGQKFNPVPLGNKFSKFDDNLLIDMGNNFRGEFSLAYKHKNVFPAKYRLTIRFNATSVTGVFNIYVNGKLYPVDIDDGYGPREDFDFYDVKERGVISSVTNVYYPYDIKFGGFCSFEILVDNITEYGDVEVKLEYVEPSRKNRSKCGLSLDYIALQYYENN